MHSSSAARTATVEAETAPSADGHPLKSGARSARIRGDWGTLALIFCATFGTLVGTPGCQNSQKSTAAREDSHPTSGASNERTAAVSPKGEKEVPRRKKRGTATTELTPPRVAHPESWNYPRIKWTSKKSALARMEEGSKPGLVILKGEWCPHCRRLSTVFSDPEIMALSESFELILLDSDTPEASGFEGTGNYVPRTLFLRPDGSIDTSLVAPNPEFPHFFSVSDKRALGEAMQTAIDRYGS